MVYLLDTGVLLRLFDSSDSNCRIIRKALWEGRKAGHKFVISIQNVAEFWNVSTRPATVRGGYGFKASQAEKRLRVLERVCAVLPDRMNLYAEWRHLVVFHAVIGVQVHDARLVAWMMTQAVTHIITLNPSDFLRYSEIEVLSPESMKAHLK